MSASGYTYKSEIEKVARGWDYLDEIFEALDRRHEGKLAKASNEPVMPIAGQMVLPGL